MPESTAMNGSNNPLVVESLDNSRVEDDDSGNNQISSKTDKAEKNQSKETPKHVEEIEKNRENNTSGSTSESSATFPQIITNKTPSEKYALEAEKELPVQNGLEKPTTPGDELVTVSKKNALLLFIERRHVVEKFVFVVSVISLILLTCCIVSVQWILPYYFTVSLPILLIIRIIMYWKLKWQFFLIDFCYFANIYTLITIWAAPDNEIAFCVLFASVNGPLGWAIPVFRNSVVFHSADKMTSLFIHVIPFFLSYCIRWFPTNTSLYWYKSFNTNYDQDIYFLLLWMVVVPTGCYIVHGIFLILVIHVICRPGPNYLYSYNYLTEKYNKLFKRLNIGPKMKPVMYYGSNWFMGLVTILSSVLFYKYFIAHTVAMCFFLFMGIYNGASFYMDKFAYKGHRAESA